MDTENILIGVGIAIFIVAIVFKFLKKDTVIEEAKVEQKVQAKKKESTITYGKVTLFFGSQSGTANKFCNILSQEALDNDFEPSVEDLKDFKQEFFTKGDNLVILCMATHGEGDPTDNAKEFFEWIKNYQEDNAFKNIRYTVFGLGNTQYEHYNAMGRQTNQHFERLGAKRVYKYGEGDDNSSLEDDFNEWKENLWTELKKIITPIDLSKQNDQNAASHHNKKKSGTAFKLVPTEAAEINFDNAKNDGKKYEFLTDGYIHGTVANVKSIKELRQNNNDGSTLHMEIDLKNTNLKYKTAMNIEIFAENDPALVEKVGAHLNLDLNQRVELVVDEEFIEKFKYPFPSPISVRSILSKFCDFQGQLMKKTLKDLAKLTSNEEHKTRLEKLASAAGKKEFDSEIYQKKKCLFDLLKEYQIVPTLEQFVDLCPRISPRLFTISSSDIKNPEIVTVTDSLVADKLEDGSIKHGICSKYLINFNNKLKNGMTGNRIRVGFKTSSFILPQDSKTPIIMIGPGTGIAPFIAFCQEKEALLEKGINICPGEFTLYFGCRHQNGDFIFREELEQYVKSGILNKLYTAFSRDQGSKVYVQDLMIKNEEEIYNTFFERNGLIYICGATAMGESVVNALRKIVQKFKNIDEQEAHKFVENLEKEKRIIKELW
ncbi:hypothetical protein ABPG74_018545 [Tetrahymena malaccensis]